MTTAREQKAESAGPLMRFNLRLPSYRNEINGHYQEKYHQFLTNPATKEIYLAPASNPVSYLFTTARKWVADKFHARKWRMTWNPPEPTEYALHAEHYKKTTVDLRRNHSSLDYIVLEKDEKKKIVDIVLNTDSATLRKHIRFGVFPPERFGVPSTQIIAALGRYFKSETQRILGGKLSTRYRAKNELCEMIQDRIEKIQPLERLLSLHKLNPKHHREAIIAALKKYKQDLAKLSKKAVRTLKQAAVFEPNVLNEVQIKIQQDMEAATKLQMQLRDAEQFSTSKKIDAALQVFIRSRFDAHIQEIEDRNRNCSYSSVDPFAVKGDLNNTIQDGFKITYTFTPDPNNPYTKEEQGLVDTDKKQASVRLFESLPHDSETIHTTLARIGLVEGRYEINFRNLPYDQVPATESRRKRGIRLATASASFEQACLIQKDEDGNVVGEPIPLEVAATTKHDWSDAGNPLTGLLRIAILGPVTGAIDLVTGVGKGLYQTAFGPTARDLSIRPYLLPSSKAEAGKWNSWLVPSHTAETSPTFAAFNPLMKPVDNNRPPQLDFGSEIYGGFANIFTSLVIKTAEAVYELGPHFGKAWHSLWGDFALAGMKYAGTPLTFDQLLTRISAEAEAIKVEHSQLKEKVRERLQSEHPELSLAANKSGAVLQAHPTFRVPAPEPLLELGAMGAGEGGDHKDEDKAQGVQQEQLQEAVNILNNLVENRQLLDFRHKHSLHHNGLGDAVHQGVAGLVQFFTHNIIQKHPLTGGIPFVTFGFLAALACYAPAQAAALGLSSGFISAMQTLGGWLANGDISEALAASFMAGKGAAGFFELLVNGKESWLATLAKDMNKSPDKAWGYFATVVAFGKFLTVQPIWEWLREHLADDQGTIWPFADSFAGLKIALVMVHLVEHHHHFQPRELERWKTILYKAMDECYRTLKGIPSDAALSAEQEAEISNGVESLWVLKDKEEFRQQVQTVLQKSAQHAAADSDNSNSPSPRSVAEPVAEPLSSGVLSPPVASVSTGPLQLQTMAVAGVGGCEQKRAESKASSADPSVVVSISEQSESKGQPEVELTAAVDRLQLLMLMIKSAESLPYLSREAKYYLHYHLRQLFPKDLAEGLYELAEPPKERSILTTFVSERLEYIPVFLRGLAGLSGFLGGICGRSAGSTEGVKKLYELMESDLGSLISMIEGCNNVVANDVLRHLGKFYAIPMDAIGRAKSSCGDTRFNNENAESPAYNGKVWRDAVKGVSDGARALFGFFPGVDPKSRGHVSGRHAVADAVEHIFTPVKP